MVGVMIDHSKLMFIDLTLPQFRVQIDVGDNGVPPPCPRLLSPYL